MSASLIVLYKALFLLFVLLVSPVTYTRLPARAHAPAPGRHWWARPAPRLSQEAARRAEVNMAAKASGEPVGERRGRARPCPAPACAGQRGLPRAALGSEAGRVGERGSRGAGVYRVSLTGTASAGSTVAGRVSSPALQ